MTSDESAKDLIDRFGIPRSLETLQNMLKIAFTRGEREGLHQGMAMGQRTMESALSAVSRVLGQ